MPENALYSENPPYGFVADLMKIGIISYDEQETLWHIARRCTLMAGIPTASTLALIGMKAGTFAMPGGGTVSGAAVGALIGLAAGTGTCMALNVSLRNDLRKLAQGQ